MQHHPTSPSLANTWPPANDDLPYQGSEHAVHFTVRSRHDPKPRPLPTVVTLACERISTLGFSADSGVVKLPVGSGKIQSPGNLIAG